MKKGENVSNAYTVRAEHEGFILEKNIKSENQYNAVITFLVEVSGVLDCSYYEVLEGDIHILSVTQEWV